MFFSNPDEQTRDAFKRLSADPDCIKFLAFIEQERERIRDNAEQAFANAEHRSQLLGISAGLSEILRLIRGNSRAQARK